MFSYSDVSGLNHGLTYPIECTDVLLCCRIVDMQNTRINWTHIVRFCSLNWPYQLQGSTRIWGESFNNNNGPNGHLFYVGGDLMMRRGMLPIIMLPDGDLGFTQVAMSLTTENSRFVVGVLQTGAVNQNCWRIPAVIRFGEWRNQKREMTEGRCEERSMWNMIVIY